MPTSEVMQAWVGTEAAVSTLAGWAKLPEELSAAFFEELGTDADEPFMSLAYMSDEEVESAIDAIILNEAPLKGVAKSKLRRFMSAVRLAGGTADKPAPATPPPPIVVQAGSSNDKEKVCLGTVILQGSDVKIDLVYGEVERSTCGLQEAVG